MTDKDPFDVELGKQIRLARGRRSRTEVVNALPGNGRHAQTLASYEQGARAITAKRLHEIGVVIGIPAWALLAAAEGYGDVEEREPIWVPRSDTLLRMPLASGEQHPDSILRGGDGS